MVISRKHEADDGDKLIALLLLRQLALFILIFAFVSCVLLLIFIIATILQVFGLVSKKYSK